MKMKKIFFPVLLLLLLGCSSGNKDIIFHYSVLKALDNGVLEGDMTIGQLKKHGDLGLGTYNHMDGEMVVLDGSFYRISQEGKLLNPGDDTLIPYSIVTFYNEDAKFTLEGDITYPSLKAQAAEKLPSLNYFYAFRITGEFEYIKCGGANAQNKPYNRSLNEMLADRPVYVGRNITGTLVGFWCPAYIGDINTAGFHLHFISDDHTLGGHLMEFRAGSLNLGYDIKFDYKIILPDTEIFRDAKFRNEPVNY
jgi:acetolactate decarboxylase